MFRDGNIIARIPQPPFRPTAIEPSQLQAANEHMLGEATVATLQRMGIADLLRITQHLPVVAMGEKQNKLTLGTCGAGTESTFDVLKEVQRAAVTELKLNTAGLEHAWHIEPNFEMRKRAVAVMGMKHVFGMPSETGVAFEESARMSIAIAQVTTVVGSIENLATVRAFKTQNVGGSSEENRDSTYDALMVAIAKSAPLYAIIRLSSKRHSAPVTHQAQGVIN